MNYRLTIAATVAVILASVSEHALINGGSWLRDSIGAVIVVALAGTLTRLSPVPAAIGAAALAAAASAPMIAAQSLYIKAAAGVVIACCAASASGLRPLRVLSGVVTYVAALLLYLDALLATGQSLAVVIPTSASLRHLLHLASSGASLSKYSPPVTATHGVLLLAAGSIGAAAILVDFLAVRLRKPAIAGLPLLVLYMAPIATTASVDGLGGAFTFVLAATGYLALLSSDGRIRLRGWGRVVTVWHAPGNDERLGGADIGGLTATGRRIGVAAVCAAIMVPLVLPTLNLHRLFSGSSFGGGGVTVGLPNPVDEMNGLLARKSPVTVLTYHSNANSVGNYLQVYVLHYDAAQNRWDLLPPEHSTPIGSGPLQQPPGYAVGTPAGLISTRITLGQVTGYSWKVFFLPVPYWPTQLTAPGSWREAAGTLMVYSSQANHAGQSYTVTSGDAEPTPAELSGAQRIPASIRRTYLGFKSPQTAQLTRIARQVTQGKTSAFAKAVALEQWFHSAQFTYSLRPAPVPSTPKGLLTFLTTTRQGYCQQFAFAMAVLARLIGIPSRVAIGYTAGTQRANGSWVVTSADAHAWPELYFTNVGWLRFEPTPGGNAGQASATQPSYVIAASPGQGAHKGGGPRGGGSATSPTASPSASPFRGEKVAQNAVGAAGAGPRSRGGAADTIGWSVRLPSESPRAVARRVGAEPDIDDDGRLAVGRIALVVERARYSPAPQAAGAIRADVAQVHRSLARSVGPAIRWRARLLPSSTLGPVRGAVRQSLGLLGGWAPAQGQNTFG